MNRTAPTPKVFNAKYRPPQPTGPSSRSWKPVIIVACIVLGGLALTRLPVFQISSIELIGNVSAATKEKIESLRGTTIFSDEVSRVVSGLRATDPLLADLQCSRGLPATLRCSASSREAAFIWKSGDRQFLLDRSGFIFAPASGESLLTIEDNKKQPAEIGQRITTEEVLDGYRGLTEALRAASFTVRQFSIDESFYQLTAHVTGRTDTAKPFPPIPELRIVMTTTYPFPEQIAVVVSLLEGRAPMIRERVDVRVPGNVYYY